MVRVPRLAALVALAAALVATGSRDVSAVQSAPCRDNPRVAWLSPAPDPRLDRWCSAVGAPVSSAGAAAPGSVKTLFVVTWNVYVGGGRIEEFVAQLKKAAPADAGFVLLVQEAFRQGPAVPWPQTDSQSVPSAIRPRRPAPDIAATARELGWSLLYVPSMRNGIGREADREDRGNAILSSEPMADLQAIELPFGAQRRVAVAATVRPRGAVFPPLRIASMHLDTSSDRRVQAAAMAAALETLRATGVFVVAGGDLNSMRGFGDPAYKTLAAAVSPESCGTGRTNVWPARVDLLFGMFVGRLDFIFSTRDPNRWRAVCHTEPQRFGSDHHPVVLRLDAA